MGRGRPPKPGTEEEKAAARRERVRNNVRALRERRKQEAAADALAARQDDSRLGSEPSTSNSGSARTTPSSKYVLEYDQTDDHEVNKQVIYVPVSARSGILSLMESAAGGKTSVPRGINSTKTYAIAMLSTVREMFLPDSIYLPPDTTDTAIRPWDSEQLLWTPCAFWITSAFTKASNQESSLLKSSLLAIGMLLKGSEYGDNSLKVASLEMYKRSLQGIRRTLEPLIQGTSERPKDVVALYLSCHAAAMFELVRNADLRATMRHLRGVSQLICHLGDGSDTEGQAMAWLLLQDYRFAEMGLCLKFRYTSYSSIARRRFEEGSLHLDSPENYPTPARGRQSQNLTVLLTDLADELTTVMVRFDQLKLRLSKGGLSEQLSDCLEVLDDIFRRFPLIHHQIIEKYGDAFVFKDTEDDSEESFRFLTYDIGAAWCYNLMTQLYCLETSIEVTTYLLHVQGHIPSRSPSSASRQSPLSDESTGESTEEFASIDRLHELRRLLRAICIQLTRCLWYFLQTDKGITGQALAIYPLDTAVNILSIEMARLNTDLSQARIAGKSKEHIAVIYKDIADFSNAQAFVGKMQNRAKQFGLPAFHETSPRPSTIHSDSSNHGVQS